MEEKTVASRTIYKGKVLDLKVDTVTLPNGKTTEREVVVHRGAVAVVAVNETGEIVLIKQFRYPTGKILWEIPAGKINAEEVPQDCAVRELAEETGFGAREWQHMATFYTTPGFSDELMYVYLARDLYTDKREMDDDEFIEIHPVPLENATEMIKSGEIADAKSIAGILLASLRIEAT